MRWPVRLLAALVVVLLGASFAVIWVHQPAHPVTVDAAVRAFRASGPPPPAAEAPAITVAPAPGPASVVPATPAPTSTMPPAPVRPVVSGPPRAAAAPAAAPPPAA